MSKPSAAQSLIGNGSIIRRFDSPKVIWFYIWGTYAKPEPSDYRTFGLSTPNPLIPDKPDAGVVCITTNVHRLNTVTKIMVLYIDEACETARIFFFWKHSHSLCKQAKTASTLDMRLNISPEHPHIKPSNEDHFI